MNLYLEIVKQTIHTLNFTMMLIVPLQLFRLRVMPKDLISLSMYGIISMYIQYVAFDNHFIFVFSMPVTISIGMFLLIAKYQIEWTFALLIGVVGYINYGVLLVVMSYFNYLIFNMEHYAIIIDAMVPSILVLAAVFLFQLIFWWIMKYYSLGVILDDERIFHGSKTSFWYFLVILLYTITATVRFIATGRALDTPYKMISTVLVDLALVGAYISIKIRKDIR